MYVEVHNPDNGMGDATGVNHSLQSGFFGYSPHDDAIDVSFLEILDDL